MPRFPVIRFSHILWSLVLGLSSGSLQASLKVDLNQNGRPNAADPAYVRWDIPGGNSFSQAFTDVGITVTFTRTGTLGTGLKATWYKTYAESSTLNAKMISDGLTVADSTTGGQIEMSISGLETGHHTLLTYHNTCDSPAAGPFSPIHIDLNGERIITSLQPSNRVDDNFAAPVAYLEFDAIAGSDVVILFQADTSDPTDLAQNVVINGFEIDTPNSTRQAQNPLPASGDEHIDADVGSYTLSWSAAIAGTAVAHDVYFGTDADTVAKASHTSPEFQGSQTALTFNAANLTSREMYYWRIDEVDSLGNVTRGDVWSFRPRHFAFPGAEGYGRFAVGGRFGRVVEVNSLEDYDSSETPIPGTLRYAIEQETGPRTIVFSVGGLITLKSRLTLNGDHVTIAGQTAPGKGICLRAYTMGLSGAEDVVVRFIRSRPGNISGTTIDGMGMTGSDYCIMDHCSISWTIDESFSSRNARNITLQDTLISEALNIAGHKNYPPGTAHGYAASIGGDVGSFHHNLLAHCYGRNWSLAGGLDGDGNFSGRLDITNNVVYNWGHRATDGGAHEVNFVNNYYKPGAGTDFFYALNAQYDNFPGTQQYYFSGNVMPGRFNESNQTAGRTSSGYVPTTYSPWVSSPFFDSGVTTQSATAAYKQVLSDVGCNQPIFDDHDIRIINETRTGTYTYTGTGPYGGYPGMPNSQDDVGGWEDYPVTLRAQNWDTDHDGLPDWWETLHGTNPSSPSGDFSDAHSDTDGDGYTLLEDYLHWMASPHLQTSTDTMVELDLSTLARGYTALPTYTFSGQNHCTVLLLAGTSKVQITPETGYTGLASFSFKVTDSVGDNMTREIGLLVASPATASANATLELVKNNDALELHATGPADQTCRIDHSEDLQTWNELQTFTATGDIQVFPVPSEIAATPRHFFHLVVE